MLAILVLGLGTAGSVLLIVFVASLVAVLRERPSPKHFGPLLLVWGLAMLMLIFIRDLGSSLMFFGGFLALLYVATARLSLVGVGATMFFGGAFFLEKNISHVHDRVTIWLDTFSQERVRCPSTGQVTEFVNCQGYQVAQSLFAQADGGLFGQGFGKALIEFNGSPLLPAAHTDLIYSVLVNEAGLFGAAGVLGAYLLFALPRLQDRDGRQRRLLEAARGRPHVGLRPPGVRDRRRRHPRDPADRRDAAVRLLRRQLDRREHGPARAAADRLRPRARRAPAQRRSGVNNQIRQVYGVLIVLFALLVGFTSYWSVLDAKGLNDNPDNRRTLIEEQTIPRGLIFARDGKTRIAINHSERRGDARVFVRDYPTGGLFAHPIGYSFIQNGRRGLESSRNDDLAGKRNEFESIFAGLEGRDREGEDVVTNLDVAGTNAAVNGLAGRKGAVVAIEPQTGKVRVMVSIPEYDPNRIPTDFHALDTDPNKPTLNRTHAGALSARIDVQGGDRDGCARHRASSRPTRSSTAPRRGRSAVSRCSTPGARISGRSR